MILPIYSAAISCIPPLLKQSLIRVLVRNKSFGSGAVFQKKGVGTRRLKYRLPENPGILNSPHTSVRGNGLVEGHTYVNHVR